MKLRKINMVGDNLGRQKSHIQWETKPRISHEYLTLEAFGIIFSRNNLGGNHTPVGRNIKDICLILPTNGGLSEDKD